MVTLALLVLAASPAAGLASAPTSARHTAAQACVSVVNVRPTPRMPREARSWIARRLLQVEFDARLRPRTTADGIELHVLTPGGDLYQKLVASLPEPPSEKARARVKPVASARLSVAGTQITQRGLYGKWSVVPYLAGELEPCGPSATFTLVP